MDLTQFGPQSPGEIVRVDSQLSAFVPAPLPPRSWELPASLWPLLAEAKAKLGLLEGIGRTLSHPSLLLRPLGSREAIQSSRIEGTYATARELLLFEADAPDSEKDSKQVNEWREVYNYRVALEHATTTTLPLSLRLIRDVHRILMTGVRGKDRTPGEFRRIQVAIGSNHRFVPPPVDRLASCLDEFEKAMHAAGPTDPLIDCFLCHYQFEAIHPFEDGNGRVGRLVLATMLRQRCELTQPWLYLSEYFEKYREEYIQHLFRISTEGAWEPWIEFCLRGVVAQSVATVQLCEEFRRIRDDYTKRIADIGGSERLHRIAASLFDSPFVRIADLTRRLGITYPTAKADVDRLIAAKILQELPDATPKTFYAEEVFRIAYA